MIKDQEISGEVLREIEAAAFEDVEELIGPAERAYAHQTVLFAILRTPKGTDPAQMRNAIKKFYAEQVEWILRRHDESGAAERLSKELSALTPTTAPPRTPHDEVAAYEAVLIREAIPRWTGPEIDGLAMVLADGERIATVMDDRVVTDKREIDRYGLRFEVRPVTIRDEKFIEEWNRDFGPSKHEIANARKTSDGIGGGND